MDEEPERPRQEGRGAQCCGEEESRAVCLPGDLSCPGPLCVECTRSKDQNQAQEGEAGSQVRVRPEVKCG